MPTSANSFAASWTRRRDPAAARGAGQAAVAPAEVVLAVVAPGPVGQAVVLAPAAPPEAVGQAAAVSARQGQAPSHAGPVVAVVAADLAASIAANE